MKGASAQRREGGVLALSGELRFETVPGLWKETEPLLDEVDRFEVDLADVTRSDSSGLALLIELTRRAGREGKEIRFLRVPEQLLAIARVGGLERVLPLGSE